MPIIPIILINSHLDGEMNLLTYFIQEQITYDVLIELHTFLQILI